jgi:DNA invertase Pin-like site-specific DNA recombinase
MHDIAIAAPAVYAEAKIYTIAPYLRISQEDGNTESDSIVNQRALIREYIASRAEFDGAKLNEYSDDGVTGTLTNRSGYRRLLRDADIGAVDCIIVKDLSRIGRDMLETDDMLMNRLVTLGVRFIAIGDGYDSFKNPLSNLELAIINLANQHYVRDLAQKSMSVKLMKMKRGEHLCAAPFGYAKSKTEKNRLVVDDEAAEYVRLMFSLAAEGNNFTQIAYIMNAQNIPSPAEYKRERGLWNNARADGVDREIWTSGTVGNILNSLCYTGTAAGYRTTTVKIGEKHTYRRPKEEWIIVPNAHPAIIPQAEYDRAREAISRKKRADAPIDHIFFGKVKCPVCGRTMKRINSRNPAFKCYTNYYTDRYGCRNFTVSQAKIEAVVLNSVKPLAAALIDREELRLAVSTKNKNTKAELENKVQAGDRAIRLMEEAITKNFTALVSGKMMKDDFVSKKEAVNGAITLKKAAMEQLREQLHAVSTGKSAIEKRLAELRPFLTVESLDKELVDSLIDKILVHSEHEIEIVWAGAFENGGNG